MSTNDTTEDLGAGFALRVKDTDDGTARVTLCKPDGEEETLVGGYEHESPEDMTWGRTFEDLFRAGLNAGIAIGKHGGSLAGLETMKGKLSAFYQRLSEHAWAPDGSPMEITPAEARSLLEMRRQRDLLAEHVDKAAAGSTG
jgi:hypothetical protein